MEKPSFFRRYFIPGFVFQSVVIAGGYGTGRELVEFFVSRGPRGGLWAMAVATLIWSAVCMASFVFAAAFHTFDYRSFFRRLLGRAWPAFELCYIMLILIIAGVIAAASGSLLQETFGLPYAVGVLGIMAAVGGLEIGGSDVVERYMAGWAMVLYSVYAVFAVWCFVTFRNEIDAALTTPVGDADWFLGGVQYAAYNLGVVPAVLFTLRHHKRRRDAAVAGFVAGPFAMVPALLLYLPLVSQYPAILDKPVPANYMLTLLGSRTFQVVFQIGLFGTLIATGVGLIHALNERIAQVLHEKGRAMPRSLRGTGAIGFLLIGAILSSFGLIELIAKGYGTLTWLFLLVYVIPVLTLGVWMSWKAKESLASTG